MASTNTITQTSPKVAGATEIMANEVLAGVTFQKFKNVPATRDKFRMWNGSTSGMIQDYSDSPTETGGVTVADEEFTITKKSVFHAVPYDKFKDTEFNLSISNLKSQGLPSDFVAFVARDTGAKASELAENEIWNSEGGLTGDPTGLEGIRALIRTNLTAASKTSQIVTSTTLDPTDAAEIDDVLAALVATFPKEIVANKAKFRIYMNQTVNDAYYRYLSGVAATNIPQNNALVYQNYTIEIIPNLSDAAIVVAKPENINVSLAVSGDLTALDVIDMYALGGGNKARIVGNWGYGVGIATTDFALFEYNPA